MFNSVSLLQQSVDRNGHNPQKWTANFNG